VTEVPPSRYRVVERGRRLEVIDTRAEGAAPARTATSSPGPGPAPGPASADRRPGLPDKVRFDGTREWTTHGFYDAGGPRRVRLGPVAMQALGYGVIAAVVAIVALVVLAGPGVLAGLAVMAALGMQHGKPWLTRRLDRIAVG